MMKNIYIYSNSTRGSNIKFNANYIPDVQSYHLFINDAHALFSNFWQFYDVLDNLILVTAFDSWDYIKNLFHVFSNAKDFNFNFSHFYTCNTKQYCVVNPNTLCYVSTNGIIQNIFNGKTHNLTTGIRSIQICQKEFPNIPLTLVNFSDTRNSSYNIYDKKIQGPHDFVFEKELTKNFKHIYI